MLSKAIMLSTSSSWSFGLLNTVQEFKLFFFGTCMQWTKISFLNVYLNLLLRSRSQIPSIPQKQVGHSGATCTPVEILPEASQGGQSPLALVIFLTHQFKARRTQGYTYLLQLLKISKVSGAVIVDNSIDKFCFLVLVFFSKVM